MTDDRDALVLAEAQAVVSLLEAARFSYRGERQLHDGLEYLLKAAGVPVARAVRLSLTDRVDFAIRSPYGFIGVEVNLRGSTPRLAERLERCAATGQLAALVLVTARAKHRRLAGARYPGTNDGPTVPVLLAKI